MLDQAALVATGAPVHQIWHPVGDDETSPQLGVEGQHELLLDHLPEDEVKTKTNYLARLKELQSQLATPGCDMTRLMAEVLIVQNLMKTEGRVEGGLGSAASTKLPATLYQAYDKRTAKISITSHLEKINDFLLTQPKHKHLDLLFLSLAGDTLTVGPLQCLEGEVRDATSCSKHGECYIRGRIDCTPTYRYRRIGYDARSKLRNRRFLIFSTGTE